MIRCRLSRILGERRIKVSEFARQSGVARRTLWGLYHEKAKGITFDVLDKICRALEIQPGQLLEREEGERE